MIKKIISGGQTGADRAALDWAIWHKIEHGGWCPKGRKALDGPLEARYQLVETPSANYLQRTEWNVRDSDATVIFTLGPKLTGGSKKTGSFAETLKKPWIHICRSSYSPSRNLIEFIRNNQVAVLNIAGSRESKEPGLYDWVKAILEESFYPNPERGGYIGGTDEG